VLASIPDQFAATDVLKTFASERQAAIRTVSNDFAGPPTELVERAEIDTQLRSARNVSQGLVRGPAGRDGGD
jgi:hypothetical protein